MTKEEIDKIRAQGYRVVSRKYGTLARIDRPDWIEYMAREYAPWSLEEGMEWINCLGIASAEDYYRRGHSKDKIEIEDRDALKQMESSCWAITGYCPIDNSTD